MVTHSGILAWTEELGHSAWSCKEPATTEHAAAAAAEAFQSCPGLCDPVDCSPSGSSVHGIHQDCWSRWPCPPPGDLPNLGIEPGSPALQADSLPLSHQGSPTEHACVHTHTLTLYCKENAPERGQMRRKRVDLLRRHKIT